MGHILDRNPLERAMNVLHSREKVRTRNAKLGQARTIGTAADRNGTFLDPQILQRRTRQFHRGHVVLQPVSHVTVLWRNLAEYLGARFGRGDGLADLPQQRALGLQSRQFEIAKDETHDCLGSTSLDVHRVDEALIPVRRFRCHRGLRQGFDDPGHEVDLVALSTSSYEQLVFLDPRSGETRPIELETPLASTSFDPADWPFWPSPGLPTIRSALSTRVCVYTDRQDSLGESLGPNRFCDDTREGFVTRFTAGSAVVGDRLFVATSNLLRSSQARYAPGTVLVFDIDRSVDPPRLRPDATGGVILVSGFNPTSLEPYTTRGGRRLLLVGVSGAIAIGTDPDRIRSESAIDVIDADSRTLIATIPLGRAGLGDSAISIDPTRRIALVGAFTSRALFGIDLAALDTLDPGPGPEPLPIRLDGTMSGFPDARLYDSATPFVLPKRADGPSPSQCATLTSVAFSQAESYAVATDFCDGTISVLGVAVPPDRDSPLDPASVLTLERVENVVSPVIDTATGRLRAIDRVLIRPGRAGIDYTGPDVYFTAGLPEGAVCGVRINSF